MIGSVTLLNNAQRNLRTLATTERRYGGYSITLRPLVDLFGGGGGTEGNGTHSGNGVRNK